MSGSLLDARIFAGQRVAAAVEYDGSRFFGWQALKRPHHPSVQETVEQALSRVAAQPVQVQCAGRTDTGVHASRQIIHFDAPVDRPEKAWVLGGNIHLPDGVAIRWAKPVDADFHARFSATARRYRYLILNRAMRSAHVSSGVTVYGRTLDASLMHQAAQALLGERDFSAFRAAGCQSRTPMRYVHHVRVSRLGEWVVVDIKANAFLHHMVRNIVGSLLLVGSQQQGVEWVATLLADRDRSQAGATAPPNGLYLVDVDYPERFGLPQEPVGPAFVEPWFRE